ncbi:hypothetical protein GCM10027416_13870 [Okibacterium endophyticum]
MRRIHIATVALVVAGLLSGCVMVDDPRPDPFAVLDEFVSHAQTLDGVESVVEVKRYSEPQDGSSYAQFSVKLSADQWRETATGIAESIARWVTESDVPANLYIQVALTFGGNSVGLSTSQGLNPARITLAAQLLDTGDIQQVGVLAPWQGGAGNEAVEESVDGLTVIVVPFPSEQPLPQRLEERWLEPMKVLMPHGSLAVGKAFESGNGIGSVQDGARLLITEVDEPLPPEAYAFRAALEERSDIEGYSINQSATFIMLNGCASDQSEQEIAALPGYGSVWTPLIQRSGADPETDCTSP